MQIFGEDLGKTITEVKDLLSLLGARLGEWEKGTWFALASHWVLGPVSCLLGFRLPA